MNLLDYYNNTLITHSSLDDEAHVKEEFNILPYWSGISAQRPRVYEVAQGNFCVKADAVLAAKLVL